MNKKVITLGLILLSFISQAAERRRPAPSPVNTGTFWSMQRDMPPLPFSPFPDLSIYEFEKGQYLYDDRAVDYEALRAQADAMETAEPDAGPALMLMGGSGPALTISRNGLGQIEVQIVNAPAGSVYDLYQTDRLEGNALTAAHWQKVGSGSNGQIFTFPSQSSSPVFYLLGDQDTDQDLDGLADAVEVLVTKTSPISADCPREAYEAVIDGQGPNFWFSLNDSSWNSDTRDQDPGNQVLAIPAGGNGTGGNFDTDLFDKANGAFVLDPNTDVRTPVNASTSVPVDVISGGSGSSKGSISLLFRSLTGETSAKRYVICQKGNSSQEFGVYFEDNVNPGGLKVQIGGQTTTILPTASIVFGTWYYLAITWDENAGVDRWRWHLGRVGGTLTTPENPINLAGNVGNSSTVFVGNRQNNPDGTGTFTSAFRNPGKGALDQIAFWDRELMADEIAAQFAALPHGPSVDFDLSGWSILLPVDDTGGFSGDPHTVDRVQLSSGFQYIDPGSCTKKFFYRGSDAGIGTMVFETPWNGADKETDPNKHSPRSELRGLKYDATDKKWKEDNWIPGLGGTHTLNGTCRVNVAGEGKIVIGQIHADTPKTPDNSDLPADDDSDPDGAIPAIILYFDNTTDPNNPTDPDKPYIKVSVYDRVDRSNFPGDGDADGVVHHTILTGPQGAQEGADLNYELKIVADSSTCVLHVTVNGMHPAVHPIQMHQKDIGWPNRWSKTAPNNPVPFNSEDDATRLYFKAGCYYPSFTGSGVAPKVTFTSLSVTHTPVVSIAVAPATVNESGLQAATITLSRDQTDQQIEVLLNFTGTATFSGDYSVSGLNSNGRVTMPAGVAAVNLTITPIPDTLDEGVSESVIVTVASQGTAAPPNNQVTLTITDDD